MALDAKRRGEKVAIMSGGELTVTVTRQRLGRAEPGIRARPRHRACMARLASARLAGDTDGIDGGGGNADDPAGAIVFPDTLARAARTST